MESDQNGCIFVVDDDEDIREIVREILLSHGYRVSTANNGSDALDQLRAGVKPCLILLDLMMPKMSGFEFRAEQLQDPELASIPVAILTGAGAVTKSQVLGAEILRKPMELDPLLSLVSRFCTP